MFALTCQERMNFSPDFLECVSGSFKCGRSAMVCENEMSSAAALDLARNSTPQTETAGDTYDANGRRPGDLVGVTPDDYGRVPVTGRIVSLSTQSIAIRRTDDLAGDIVVHFPRAGFLVTPIEPQAN